MVYYVVFSAHETIPIGVINASVIIVIVLHIVGAAVACTIEFCENGVGGTGFDSLTRYHVAELGTAAVFAYDAVVDDHIDVTFHYLVSRTCCLGHDATAIELINQGVVDAPGNIARDPLLTGCGYRAEMATVDVAVGGLSL